MAGKKGAEPFDINEVFREGAIMNAASILFGMVANAVSILSVGRSLVGNSFCGFPTDDFLPLAREAARN